MMKLGALFQGTTSAADGGGTTRATYTYCILAFIVLSVVSLVGNRVKSYLEATNNDQEMIQKYLIHNNNGSSSLLAPKPKLWIHTKYEKNSRKWSTFHDRSSRNNNQPYLNLTVETVVNQCGSDFDICLIDDESFSYLLSDWKVEKNQFQALADPRKAQLRQEGMLRLLFKYGGLVVPNSFIAFRNLIHLYDRVHTNGGKPFMVEQQAASNNHGHVISFTPSTFFLGAEREDPMIHEMVQALETFHSSQDNQSIDLLGVDIWTKWCSQQIHRNRIQLIGGEEIGIKTQKGAAVPIESLFQELSLELDYTNLYGIYLPADEILARNKYQWFCVLSKDEIYRSNAIIAKMILAALLNGDDEQTHSFDNKRKKVGGGGGGGANSRSGQATTSI